MADKFIHSTEPHSVDANRQSKSASGKYRETNNQQIDEMSQSGNIMFDKRVVRGNTYAAQVLTANAQDERERARLGREREKKKRAIKAAKTSNQPPMPSTPPAVGGRKHMEIQTENFLEELTDNVPEVDEETQTDFYMDRPPSPLFVPAKIGVDQSTQIENDDLFDFNLEVAPILEVLIGKTLQVSMMELMESEELLSIRLHQQEFEQTRNAELAEVQRLEAEAKRKFAEKNRRVKEQKECAEARHELQQKIAARSFAKNYLADLHGNVFSKLMESGHFFDPLAREVENDFIPWLFEEAVKDVDKAATSRAAADQLLDEALTLALKKKEEGDKGRADYAKAVEEAKQKAIEEAKRLEEEAAAAALKEAEEGDGNGD